VSISPFDPSWLYTPPGLLLPLVRLYAYDVKRERYEVGQVSNEHGPKGFGANEAVEPSQDNLLHSAHDEHSSISEDEEEDRVSQKPGRLRANETLQFIERGRFPLVSLPSACSVDRPVGVVLLFFLPRRTVSVEAGLVKALT
jgi:hypothetical protein